ncbi:hypothetical protein GPL10_19395 [Bacteroides fragilis]|uniref:hypothetical protein n=1 Tax=Bacteroides fragilis TaxID=817 RepID=UPI001C01DDF4|nr:hypothetical protein [Bacteroides fragilis]MBT9907875.1 hypothetical protein [Bacteroides fragilis]
MKGEKRMKGNNRQEKLEREQEWLQRLDAMDNRLCEIRELLAPPQADKDAELAEEVRLNRLAECVRLQTEAIRELSQKDTAGGQDVQEMRKALQANKALFRMADERTKAQQRTDEYLQQLSRQIDQLERLKINHSHSFNVIYSRPFLVQVTIVALFLFSLVFNAWQLKRGWQLSDNDLKYRYVLMSGGADAKTLDILENCFEWNRDRKLIRKIRKEVEDFERWTEMEAAEMLRAKRQQK